jgi:uncharacterized SAM-binding protein YcdF (DUF218 family)
LLYMEKIYTRFLCFFALLMSYLTGLIFIYCWFDTRHFISLYSQSTGNIYPRIYASDKSIFMWRKTSAVEVKKGRYYITSTGENIYFAIYISMITSRTKLSDSD